MSRPRCFMESHACEGELIAAPKLKRPRRYFSTDTHYCEAHMQGCRSRSVLKGHGLNFKPDGARVVAEAAGWKPSSPSESWDWSVT